MKGDIVHYLPAAVDLCEALRIQLAAADEGGLWRRRKREPRMLAGLTHRLGELGSMGGDVAPENGRNPNRGGVVVEIVVGRDDDAALSEARKDRRDQVAADFVLAEPPRFPFGVEPLDPHSAEVVL